MRTIEHRGKSILYFDYQGLEDDDLVRKIRENEKRIAEIVAKGERDLLRLTDVTGCYATPEIVEAFKEVAVRFKPYFKASAVVGIKGGKKVLLDLVNRFSGIGARPFDSVEEAKEWLAGQAKD